MNLNDAVVLVTGANRGLGLAFVEGLKAAGAKKIYAAARDPARVSSSAATRAARWCRPRGWG